MIVYRGIKHVNKIPFLCLSNEKNFTVEIPLDQLTADRIAKYLDRLSHIGTNPVLINDEPETPETL